MNSIQNERVEKSPDELRLRLASALPDLPRWVEARSLLLSGAMEVRDATDGPALSFIVVSRELRLAVLAGQPPPEAIARVAASATPVDTILCAPENATLAARALPGWVASNSITHELRGPDRMPDPIENFVRLATRDELEAWRDLPAELSDELRIAARRSAIAVAMFGPRPVSFCYAAHQTETLWDVSIETLPGFRNRGLGGLAVSLLVHEMRRRGREPVWGAEENNLPSARLAARLGFAPVDRLVVFHRPVEGGFSSEAG